MSDGSVEDWVAKADEDHRAASSLDPESTPGGICFHCQQCIEKYVKAALVRYAAPVPKIHNLIVLNDLAAGQDSRFEPLNDRLDILNPYSVIARYPGFEITADDARKAVETMQELRAQIRQLLELEPEE